MSAKKYFRNKWLPVGIGFVAVVALVFCCVYALSRRPTHKPAESSFTTNCPATACIKLLGKTADPDTITVTTGSYVQFNSADGGMHNIALEHSGAQHDDPTEYESGDFKKDEAWKVQIKHDGAYTFRDKYNPGLEINIVAYTKGRDYKVQ